MAVMVMNLSKILRDLFVSFIRTLMTRGLFLSFRLISIGLN